ncbi:MAG: beta-lactamase domain protein [Thermoleophilia bacterium]|nr:beta-lactamase domain protein [Thermoleophilia bacterium]
MSDLQLTPIGTSPAWYNPGQPCSGFLLEAAGSRVLVDCGSGVVSRYLALFGAERPIDAIVLGHVHPDHAFDLVPLKYGIDYGDLDGWRPELWLPPGARDRLTRLASAWDDDFDFFTETFEVHDFGVEQPFEVGPFACRALEVPHYIESFALRFEHRGTTFGYTSDLGPTDRIAPFMDGVDLLLSEAGYSPDGDLAMHDRGHITAREAGRIATDANAHSLLLTHVPEELGLDRARAAAADEFSGPVAIATSGETYVVARRLAAASA